MLLQITILIVLCFFSYLYKNISAGDCFTAIIAIYIIDIYKLLKYKFNDKS